MKTLNLKIVISERALLQRINRYLKKKSLAIKVNRTRQMELGDYYLVDFNESLSGRVSNSLHDLDDLERYSREMGVLKGWEIVERITGARGLN